MTGSADLDSGGSVPTCDVQKRSATVEFQLASFANLGDAGHVMEQNDAVEERDGLNGAGQQSMQLLAGEDDRRCWYVAAV